MKRENNRSSLPLIPPGVIRKAGDVWKAEDDEHQTVAQTCKMGTYSATTPTRHEQHVFYYFKGNLLPEIPVRPEISMKADSSP